MTMHQIILDVAAAHDLKPTDITGRNRAFAISHPRQEAMARMRAAGFSTTQIGRVLGRRDHTTIVHGARAHHARQQQMEQPK